MVCRAVRQAENTRLLLHLGPALPFSDYASAKDKKLPPHVVSLLFVFDSLSNLPLTSVLFDAFPIV
jgi:hypothetical protein